jgi:hypothetical protein
MEHPKIFLYVKSYLSIGKRRDGSESVEKRETTNSTTITVIRG